MDQRGRGGWRGGGGDRGRGGRSAGGEASGQGQGAWQTVASSGRGGGGGQFYGGQGERGRGGGGQFYGGQGGRGGSGGRGGPPPARGGHEGGRGHAPRASSSTNSGSLEGQLALQLSKLQIKPALDVVQGKRVPMKCPDKGGTLSISSLNLSVNHFRLTFDKNFSVLHYEIDIKLENNSVPSVDEKISKSDMAAIKNQIFKDRASSLPDDGGRYIFSPVKLQEGKFKVTVHGTSYLVSVVLQKRLSVGDLANAPYPREILQGLDVIMRMNSARSCIQVGKNFFMRNPSTDLGYGAAALQGFQQSIKPTENGLVVCGDYTVMAFRKPMPVIDFLLEFGFNINEKTQLLGRDRAEVERTLKNMRVTVIHRRCSQKFQVQGLTSKNASEITFLDEKSNMQRYLLDYFRETYRIDIKYKMLPCLSLSKTKTNYVPMELCQIIEGQLFPKDKLRDGNMTLKNMALISSKRRLDAIQNMVNSEDGPCRGRILDEFHLTVCKNMTDVTARVLQRPTLKLLNSNGNASKFDIPNNDCQWNLLNNKVLRGKPIKYWAVLDFSKRRRPARYDRYFDVNDFIPTFVKRFSDLGIEIERNPLFVEQSAFDVLSDPDSLRQTLLKCKKNGGDRLQILLCPMLDRHEGYKTLKLICETELGIVTQCFLPGSIKNMDQYLANLALKINAKRGGCNFELFDSLPGVNPNCPILFIGADVNHPSGRNNVSPSIAAVVASTNWPELNNYASIVQAQKRRQENIVDIGRMCRQLLDNFARINRVRPRHIIYFRDGVSDGQFDMVLNQELTDIKEAIESADYKPMITVVVAQKRHQTRLFPKNMNPNMRTCNVPPGTVVDKGITAPISFNFFLCSHNGLLGTSKPTHYYVLWDEFGYTSNGIQQLIYNMCFTFARCTKPVSLVPPVYYADLLAYRGRMYYEGMMGMSSSASCSSASSSSAAEIVKLPELHVAIRGGMFFL